MGLFIQRQERPNLIKDFLASKRAERQWRRNSFKMNRAMRKWHHSPEGRKRHRQLGRYLSLRRPMLGQGLFYLRNRGEGS